MPLGKLETLELLSPILPSMSAWFRGAMDDYNDTLSEAQKVRQGSLQRSLWVQREALARMREDPAVVGNFRPIKLDLRESLLLEGEPGSPANVAVVLNKADRYKGVLRTSRNRHSRRANDMLDGMLNFDGMITIPVVLYWMIRRPADPTRPEVAVVGIGEQDHSGFIWTHRLWPDADEMSGGIGDGQPTLPNMPTTRVRLRRPDVAEAQPLRIGIREEEKQQQEQKKRERRGRSEGTHDLA